MATTSERLHGSVRSGRHDRDGVSVTPAPVIAETHDSLWMAELMPRARELTANAGSVPSRNRLMRELGIGAQKAKTLRAALIHASAGPNMNDGPDPADPAARPVPDPVPQAGPGESNPGGVAFTTTAPGAGPTTVVRRSDPNPAANVTGSTGPGPRGTAGRPVRSWPVLILAAPALVAIWSGWVGLGGLTGFGPVHPLPGIWDSLTINTAITLPIGVETYAAYALRAWLSGDRVPTRTRKFAKWSALGSLLLGAAGQVIYHLMIAATRTTAPWPVTTLISCLPVVVLGMGAALAHLLNSDTETDERR